MENIQRVRPAVVSVVFHRVFLAVISLALLGLYIIARSAYSRIDAVDTGSGHPHHHGAAEVHTLRSTVDLIIELDKLHDRLDQLDSRIHGGQIHARPTEPPPPPPPPTPTVTPPPKTCMVQPLKFDGCFSDEAAAKMQLKVIETWRSTQAHPGPMPKCDDVGLCACPPKFIFNGRTCQNASLWEDPYNTLAKKWGTVPAVKESYEGKENKIENNNADEGRVNTEELQKMGDEQLLFTWNKWAADDSFTAYYQGIMAGKDVLDVGSGMARQTMKIAATAASITFVDLVEANLNVLRRVAYLKGISNANFIHLTSLDHLPGQLAQEYDFICAFGSMHHMPSELIRRELPIYHSRLKKGGRWIQLAYPVNRFAKVTMGERDFKEFGEDTDGKGTPWGEWYEPGKLLRVFRPHKFTLLWCGIVNLDEFIWFDLVYEGKDDSLKPRPIHYTEEDTKKVKMV